MFSAFSTATSAPISNANTLPPTPSANGSSGSDSSPTLKNEQIVHDNAVAASPFIELKNNDASTPHYDSSTLDLASPYHDFAAYGNPDSAYGGAEYSPSPLTFTTSHDVYSASASPAVLDYQQNGQLSAMESMYDNLQGYSDLGMDAFSYAGIMSPPTTPAMPSSYANSSVSSSAPTNSYWSSSNRSRADSMQWSTADQLDINDYQPQRAMSLPHISMAGQDYHSQMMQMSFSSHPSSSTKSSSYSRKSSVSSSGSDKTFNCSHPGCDRTFSRIQNLRSHMRCHLVTTPHNCKTCGLGFRRTTDLQRHIRTMHVPNDQKPWACPRCPKRFGRSDALKRHMSSRSKDHGCPGGVDLELLRQMEEKKRRKSTKNALQTVVEGSVY